MIIVKHKGNFDRTEKFLNFVKGRNYLNHMSKYGELGVFALSSATPVDSGKTAASWEFEVERNEASSSIVWSNTNVNDYVNIALILQHGHGTGTGGYVPGRDYINPAMKPVFDSVVDKVWAEVKGA